MNKTNNTNVIESFDFKALGARMLKYWYLFTIFLILGFSITFYNLRYSIPKYKSYGKILLKDEYSSWGQEYFLEGMELVSARNRLSNEVGMLSSYNIIRSALNKVDFSVFYYDIGKIKTTELYKKSPFTVNILGSKDSITASYFYLQIISPTAFLLSKKEDDFNDSNPYNFNTPITIDNVSIIITLNENNSSASYDEKLYSFYINDLNSLAKVYQNRVAIETDPEESSILRLTVSGETIQKEIDYINALMDEYILSGLKDNNEIASNTMNFVDEQLKEIADTLINAEQNLENFKSRTNNEKIEVNSNYLIPNSNQTEQVLIKTQFEYNYLKHTLNYLKNNDNADGIVIPSVLDASVQDPVNKSITQLIELYNQRSRLGYSVEKTSVNYQQIQNEISILKNVIIEDVNSRFERKKFELDQLKELNSSIDNKLNKLPSVEADYVRIQRIYKLNNDFYNYLLQKRSEAALAQASNVPKAKILEYASDYTVSYVGPIAKSIYLFNLGIAFLIPFLFVLGIFIFNNKIIEKGDIEATTRIPILGTIGHIKDAGNLILVNKPKSVVAEAFRTIRTNINYITKEKESFCVLITSSISGEGKTFCSINLALAYSISNKKTLLIGADLRKPKIYNDFKLKNNIGLSSYLIGKENFETVIQATEYENLSITSSGPIPPNPSELIETEKMKEFIERAKKEFDVVIIDTPPIGLVTDGMILSEFSDVNLYIVRQRYTRKAQLELINNLFETNKINHIGIVVNDLKEQRIGYGYGYSYGYGYGYGGGYYAEDLKKKSKFSKAINTIRKG